MTAKKSSEIRDRWQTAEGKQLSQGVWRRLAAKESLQDLPLAQHEGRVDLRGITAPEVTEEELPPFRNWSLHKLKGQLRLRNIEFENMDFADSQLKHLQFFNSRIVGCRFDKSDCDEWGVRATEVTHTTFIGTSLRNAVLGPWYEGRGNRYEFVDFSRADMRGLISNSATYLDCDFSNAKLDKVDFQSSSFIRCRFAGELREAMFYDHGFKTGKPDPNPMEEVDFSGATFHWVTFRRLNLDRVHFPNDEDHIVVKNYPCVLLKALAAIKGSATPHERGFRAILENYLKWMGPQQEVGIFSRLDFRERWGKEGEEFAIELLRRAEQDCARVQ